jgi:hypothetical protein
MEQDFRNLKTKLPTLFTKYRGALVLTSLGGAYAYEANLQLIAHYPGMTLPPAYDNDEDFSESLDVMLSQRKSLGFDIDEECHDAPLPRANHILGQKLDMTKEELLLERAAGFKGMLLKGNGMTIQRCLVLSQDEVDNPAVVSNFRELTQNRMEPSYLDTKDDESLALMSFKSHESIYGHGPDKLPDEVAQLLHLKALPVATQKRFQTLFAKQDVKGFVVETAYGALLKFLMPGRSSESQIMFDKHGIILNVYGADDPDHNIVKEPFTL